MPTHSTRSRRRSRAQPPHRRHFRLYDDAAAADRRDRTALDRTPRAGSSAPTGDRFRAQYVAMANGPSPAEAAGIPGINEFRGYTFHTQPLGLPLHGRRQLRQLTGLADKRVGIVGTGARRSSASRISASGQAPVVFQRTPSSIDARNNARPIRRGRPHSSRLAERRMENFNILVSGGDQDEDSCTTAGRIYRISPAPQRCRRRARSAGRQRRRTRPTHGTGRLPKMNEIRAAWTDREGPGHRRGSQALVPAVLQAPVLPRRVPADLQREVTLVDTDGRASCA